MKRRAVFLDRDDTLIRNAGVAPGGDLGDPALVELLPGAHEACVMLVEAGYALFVVTNQGGVARGRFTEDDVLEVHQRLNTLLDEMITDFRYCPFHPKGTLPQYTKEHPWRKPQPGMLFDLADNHAIDLTSSWMIGDAPRDCEAGKAAGCSTILITEDTSAPDSANVDHTAPSLLDAAQHVLASQEHQATTITLHPMAQGLADERVRASVEAAAYALAERNGVHILSLSVLPDRLTASVEGPEIVAVGFATELRRTTDTWHAGRTGRTLWKGPTEA